MSAPDLEPLDPELKALLAHEQQRPAPSPELLQGILERAARTVGKAAPTPHPPPSSPPLLSMPFAHPLAAAATLAALGVAALAGVYAPRATCPAPQTPVTVTAPEVTSAPPPAPERSDPPAPPAASASQEPVRSAPPALPASPRAAPLRPRPAPADPAPAAPQVRPQDDLEALVQEELRLINEAHAAVRSRQRERALEVLRQHEQRFPNGQLARERVVLMRRALAVGEHTPRP